MGFHAPGSEEGHNLGGGFFEDAPVVEIYKAGVASSAILLKYITYLGALLRPKLSLSGRVGPCPGWAYHVEIRVATAK